MSTIIIFIAQPADKTTQDLENGYNANLGPCPFTPQGFAYRIGELLAGHRLPRDAAEIKVAPMKAAVLVVTIQDKMMAEHMFNHFKALDATGMCKGYSVRLEHDDAPKPKFPTGANLGPCPVKPPVPPTNG